MNESFKRIQENNEKDLAIMIKRLKTIGSTKYASDFKNRYGLFVMRGVLDIVVLYGYKDFINVVIEKQAKNIKRQQDGYNTLKECVLNE